MSDQGRGDGGRDRELHRSSGNRDVHREQIRSIYRSCSFAQGVNKPQILYVHLQEGRCVETSLLCINQDALTGACQGDNARCSTVRCLSRRAFPEGALTFHTSHFYADENKTGRTHYTGSVVMRESHYGQCKPLTTVRQGLTSLWPP